jgi:hypothetical protein
LPHQRRLRDDEDSAVLGSEGGVVTIEISERDYRNLGYRPLFDDLPWVDTRRVTRAKA